MNQLYYGILLALLVYLKLNETQTKKRNFRIAALVGIIYVLCQLFKNKEGFDCNTCATGASCISSPSPPYCSNDGGRTNCKDYDNYDKFCNLWTKGSCTIPSPEKYKETAGWGITEADESIEFNTKTKNLECFGYGNGFFGGMGQVRYKSSPPNSSPIFECGSGIGESRKASLKDDSSTCEKADWLDDGWGFNILLPLGIAIVVIGGVRTAVKRN